MGKTKTAFISDSPEGKLTGEEKYKARQKKKASEAEVKSEKVHISGLKGGQRIVAISAEPTESLPTPGVSTPGVENTKAVHRQKARGTKYKLAKAKIDKNKFYKLPDAIKLIKETSYSKFVGTLELHLKVKKDKFSERVSLPHSAGKEKKVEVADENTIKKLKEGKIDFDLLLATPEMMPLLVPFAKILGPKGLMPNPKNGTIIKDKKQAEKFGGNTITVKTQKDAPVIHTTFGKASQPDKELEENANAILEAVNRKFIEKAYLSSTMSPSIKLSV